MLTALDVANNWLLSWLSVQRLQLPLDILELAGWNSTLGLKGGQ